MKEKKLNDIENDLPRIHMVSRNDSEHELNSLLQNKKSVIKEVEEYDILD